MNPGLCATCMFIHEIKHPRGGAGYWKCKNEEILEKYPPIPVRFCRGYSMQIKEVNQK